MSTPDNVARLREIKRLLDRIQQLPHVAAGAENGVGNGFYPEPSPPPLYPEGPHWPVELDAEPVAPVSRVAAGAGNGVHNGVYLFPDAPHSPAEGDAEQVAPLPIGPLSVREEPRMNESRALVPVQTTSAVGVNPWLFVTATALNTIIAAVLAVVITLGVARREPVSSEVQPEASLDKRESRAGPAVMGPIELLPIGSPREPLQLKALKPAPLPLQVRPEEAMQGSYILVLSGLPANATLSGATRMGSDAWLVSPGALRRLEIIVPEWSAAPLEVGVELRHANGTVAAQGKAWLAVPPPPVPHPAKPDRATIKQLLRSGHKLLGRGDVAAARAVYERAAVLGSAQAALALGSTYDPSRLWSLGVFGMIGSKERALHWYQRADELGHPDAKERIKALAN